MKSCAVHTPSVREMRKKATELKTLLLRPRFSMESSSSIYLLSRFQGNGSATFILRTKAWFISSWHGDSCRDLQGSHAPRIPCLSRLSSRLEQKRNKVFHCVSLLPFRFQHLSKWSLTAVTSSSGSL